VNASRRSGLTGRTSFRAVPDRLAPGHRPLRL